MGLPAHGGHRPRLEVDRRRGTVAGSEKWGSAFALNSLAATPVPGLSSPVPPLNPFNPLRYPALANAGRRDMTSP
jgi:hypothetical protein